jgi:PAS domain S-box-containing protein
MTDKNKKKDSSARKAKPGKKAPRRGANPATSKREKKPRFTEVSIDLTSDAIFWIGPDAKILYVNDTACRRLKYTQKELLGLRVYDIDANLNKDIWEEMWRDIRKKESRTLESVHVTKDNQRIPVEITGNYLKFDSKEYVIAYARSIEDRKMAELALKESESKFRLLSEQGFLAITIIQDGLLKYVNQALADLAGYTISELRAFEPEGFGRLVHPDDRPFVMEQARKKQAGETDVVTNYSFRMITKSGETKWVDLYSKTVKFYGKNADFVSLMDTTERKRAEKVMQEARDELEFLVKERTVELTEANRQLKRRIFDLYTIFELSRNFNAVLSYETLLDSFVLTSLGQMGVAKAALYLPTKIGSNEFHLARVKGMPPFPCQEVVIRPDSEFGTYITAYNRPVYINDVKSKMPKSEDLSFTDYFEDGLVVPLIFQTKLRGVLVLSGKESKMRFQDEDIEFLSILANQTAVSIENARLYDSERKALARLQEAQKLLLQTERLAVLGELSAKVAHEVNNPLNIIKNYLQLLKNRAGDDKASDYVEVVRQEINRIAAIVRQLLDIGRPVHISFTRINPADLVKEILSLMSPQLEKAQIKIHLDIRDPVPEISAWSDGLKQIFMNILMNARYAVGSGGEIYISIVPGEHTVKLTFEDTGPGIASEHIPHIFEPFYSTKREDSGTGLGLSVSNTIVKKHNGTIEFKNTERGGCFSIELPIEQEKNTYDWRT